VGAGRLSWKMEHRYIDDQAVAERYLRHALTPDERSAFESHLVDCSECADRLLLAEMFHARNGTSHPDARTPATADLSPEEVSGSLPFHARFIAQFRPWQLALLFIAAALVFAIPTLAFLFLFRR
jgi:anti-sigma factor RsiW